MTDWIRAQSSSGSPDELRPLQLAWLGDVVWEMHQRLRHCQRPRRSSDLHKAVVAEVHAAAQAKALSCIEPYLSDFEKTLAKRGRNSAKNPPRSSDAATYASATAFETIVGWLFLKNPKRLAQLLDQLEEIANDLN